MKQLMLQFLLQSLSCWRFPLLANAELPASEHYDAQKKCGSMVTKGTRWTLAKGNSRRSVYQPAM